MSDLPPFTVEPVLGRVFGDELAIRACSVAAPGQAYLAASDGSLKIYDVSVYPPIEHEHMPLPAFSTSALPNANPTKPKSVNKLSVIPHINRVLVQAENVLSFYALPAFNPVSGGAAVGGALGSGASAVKGVLAYDVDYASAKSDSIELIILKKKGAALFNLTSHGVELLREVALPNPIVTAIALKNWCLCYSDLEAYSIMDLHTSQHMKHLLPISQDPPSDEPQPPNPNQRPSIIAVGTEYLLCSHSGSSTLGVFVSADSGEPSRGTMQWSSNVRSLGERARTFRVKDAENILS